MPKKSGRVTLQDVAEATGYTVNTVSRALKNKQDISKQTCAHIQEVAREMGYVRNYIASSLRSGRTKTIAMIAGGMANPYYAVLADQLQLEAARLGYGLMILNSRDDPDMETRAVEMALSRQVDGVLITPCAADSPGLELLRNSGIPFVLLSRYLDGWNDDCVLCDDEMGGYLAGHHLMQAGHRKVAMISLHRVIYSSRERYSGFRRACEESGIPGELVPYAEVNSEQELLEQVRNWMREGYTGLFAFCDVEGWNAITILENDGLRVPEQLAIVGFDNILGYINFPKPICSIDGHLKEEAVTAIDLLRKRIHEPTLPPQHVVLPVNLVCRGSCRCPVCRKE